MLPLHRSRPGVVHPLIVHDLNPAPPLFVVRPHTENLDDPLVFQHLRQADAGG